jgi:tetratricopeptide (TPR) repeat protein
MYSTEEINGVIKQAIEKASLLLHAKKYKEAELILGQLIKVDDGNEDAWMLLGLTRYYRGRATDAVPCFERLLADNPKNADAHNNLSLCYSSVSDIGKAHQHLGEAIAIDPKNPNYWSNYGLLLRQMGDLEGAVAAFKKSLAIDEKSPYTWANLGSTYGHFKDIPQARECFQKSVAVDPQCYTSWVELSHTYFLEENWDEGWGLYENRLKYFGPMNYFRQFYPKDKELTRDADLAGKTVVLYCEQGVGDLIHFCRFIPDLQARGCKVVLHPYEESNAGKLISGLLSYNFPTLVIGKPPEYDYHCSIISLPYLLQLPIRPQTEAYLKPSKTANLDKYKDVFKIGITWAGSPLHPNDQLRSLPLRLFKETHDLPGVKLFNLQKDLDFRAYSNRPEPVDLCAGCDDMRIVDMSEYLKTFDDTAAVVQALDLVVTVDTALLHLAGALGQTTWGLIPYNPDWRWGLEKDTTVWYPKVKLFRQKTFDDWAPVFEDVKKELNAHLLSNQ